jgi:hypothetical protein
MVSIIRAIAAAIRSWLRSRRSRNEDESGHQAHVVATAKEAPRNVEEDARPSAEDADRREATKEDRPAAREEVLGKTKNARYAADEVQGQAEQARHAEEEARAAAELASQRQADDARRRGAEELPLAPQSEQSRPAEEEVHAAELESRRQADDVHRREEEDELARAAEAERARRTEEEARATAGLESQWQAEDERRPEEAAAAARAADAEQARRAEEEDRAAAELDAQRQAEEMRRHEEKAAARPAPAEETTRAAAEQKAQIQAVEAKHPVEREAANAEADCEVECARRRGDEEEARSATGQNDHATAQDERRRRDRKPPTTSRIDTNAGGGLDENGAPGELGGEDASAGMNTQMRPQQHETETPAPETVEAPVELGAPSTGPGVPAVPLRAPRLFRPAPRVPSAPRITTPARSEREVRERAAPIEVRLVFEKAGFCRVTILPRRAAGMPAELAVSGTGDPPELLALQDEWYQDVLVPEVGLLLLQGIEWASVLPGGQIARFSLSGRELYVLARHRELNGFVSTPRLVLGEEHVVLCIAELLPAVTAAIALTGSPEPTVLNSDAGIPAGWIGLRGVLPHMPVAPSPEGDVLDALRPLADVEIELTGGIRIDRQTWLNGFPPTIRLLGDANSIDTITIDGHVATRASNDGYVAPGWDSIGDHSVWCTSTSRTYSIRSGAEEWEAWDAYAWSLGEMSNDDAFTRRCASICGVLVRTPKVARSGSRSMVVAASNPVLIGARPGEIVFCKPRRHIRAGFCIGFPWFEAVWAVPADVLHCDKRTARVLLVGPPRPVEWSDTQRPRSGAPTQRARVGSAHAWSKAILDSSRKGLKTEPTLQAIAELWKSYRHHARAFRKGWR